MRQSFDVAIVGYGPVGQTLAILLAQHGWSVGVFEKQPAPYPLPRAVHFDHEIGRVLQAAGVARDLVGMTEPAYIYEWRNAAGETLLRFGRKGASMSGWPESNMFPQPELERLLDARARSLAAVEVHRGCEAVGIRPMDTGVELTVAGRDGTSADPGALCGGVRWRQQLRTRVHGCTHHRPRVLLRLAHRGYHSEREADMGPAQLAAVRPGSPYDARLWRAGSAALGVHAAPR